MKDINLTFQRTAIFFVKLVHTNMYRSEKARNEGADHNLMALFRELISVTVFGIVCRWHKSSVGFCWWKQIIDKNFVPERMFEYMTEIWN
jgi:hypothetical protein